MRGASRVALAGAQERLESLLRGQGVNAAAVADELFAITGALSESPSLRRALTDPSRDGQAKVNLIHQLLNGRISEATMDLISGLVRDRWSASGDLTDAVESLAVNAELANAEQHNRLEAVEDELFRFARTVGGDTGLRDAFSARTQGAQRKGELVERLLGGKAEPETVRLAVQAAEYPRGLRTERVLERFVEAAAERRRQLVAEVSVAVPLTNAQRDRLAASLQRIYGRAVRLNIDIDPAVIGGMRIEVEGEVLDGTVAARLADAQRRLAG